MKVSIQEVSIFVHSGVSVTAKSVKIRSDSANPPAMQARPPAKPFRHSPEAQPMADGQGETARGTSGQVSFNENGYPLNAYKGLANGEAGYCFFKGKIFPASVEKIEILQFILARRNDCAYRRHIIHL